MKQIKFFATIIVATGLLFLNSCNSGSDKKAEDATADSSAAKTETLPPAPSGPTSVMTIKSKVANYAKWKPNYDSHDSIRTANGLHNYIIARGTEDSNTLLIAMRMDDVDKAKAFAASPGLKERMKKAGVIGPPAIDYLEAVKNDTTAIQQTVRLMVTHKVTDWDVWNKAFDEHLQARMDAGLIDRVVAYTIGNNHSVTLVFAVTDMDKAKAFMNSEDLKNKMKEAGVDGPPTFFFYKVVERY